VKPDAYRQETCGTSAEPIRSLTAQIAGDWKRHSYYDQAEQASWLEGFWSDGSPFKTRFDTLNPSILVELACGHGRHTAHLLDSTASQLVTRVYLIDVNYENIKYCRKRFRHDPRVTCLQNNGFDLPLDAHSVNGLFCYDAMVHFELDAVISYIRETYRALRPGGRALFHHSNFDQKPGALYADNPYSRNFMSDRLFAHIALRAGFLVLDQEIIDWGDGDSPTLDCITLLEKPHRRAPPRQRG
jgi:SAM-dependent methyltransferase